MEAYIFGVCQHTFAAKPSISVFDSQPLVAASILPHPPRPPWAQCPPSARPAPFPRPPERIQPSGKSLNHATYLQRVTAKGSCLHPTPMSARQCSSSREICATRMTRCPRHHPCHPFATLVTYAARTICISPPLRKNHRPLRPSSI